MDTTNLDDLLNQAEAQEAEQSEWIEDINYITKNFYVDEHGVVEIKNKTIGDMSKHISVKGESYSQYIEFKIGRFFDGIDLTKMQLAIYFNIPNVGEDESRPINVYYNENEIKFGWVIPPEIAQVNLTIEFCIYARGILSDGNNYILKTKTAKYSINDGLEIGSGIIEPTNNWYLNFVLQMDEKVSQASESADRAVQAASSVDGVVEAVTTARDEVANKASAVDTQHSEVRAWHRETKQFRDEAEQFRNQAEAITGIGLAEEGKPGIVQPDGVTTKVDENGKLIVIGGGSGGGGTTDYQALENKPSIAGIELSGDKSYDELGLASKDAVARNFQTVNQNIQDLDDYTQSLGEDISTLDTELEQTNQQLQSTTDKVDNLTERTESGFKVEVIGKDIHLTDAVDGKVVEFALFGKARQNTTSGKNLLVNKMPSQTVNGVTFTINDDKSITINGTSSASTNISFNTINSIDVFLDNEEYILSGGSPNARIYVNAYNDTSYIKTIYQEQGESYKFNRQTFANVEGCTKFNFGVYVVSGTTHNNTVIKPMIRLASITDDTYEPYTNGASPNPDYPQEIETAGASGSIEVKSVGKNLLKNTAENKTMAGITYVVNDDGTVLASGTTSGTALLQINFSLPKGRYILNGCPSGGSEATYNQRLDVKGTNNIYYDVGNGISFELTEDADLILYTARCYVVGVKFDNLMFKPMIRLATDTDDTYEPYKKTLSTIPTPNGLPGIKVASGGNYTDENGQQWITDEIIRYADGSGKYIQRIGKTVFDGSEDEAWGKDGRGRWISGSLKTNVNPNSMVALCSSYQIKTASQTYAKNMGISVDSSANIIIYDTNYAESEATDWNNNLSENNVVLYYELATPIETPLTAEQLLEIDKLNTFKPITNISNNEQCGMKITYATLQEALMLQEALNCSKANAEEIANVKEEIVDIKKDLADTTFKVETIIEKADLGIKETASGEEIHLTDSAEGKAVEFALYGKAKQQTMSGKNLLNWGAFVAKNYGSIEYTGENLIATKDANTYYIDTYEIPCELKAGTYTLMATIDSSVACGLTFDAYDADGNRIVVEENIGNLNGSYSGLSYVTFTCEKDITTAKIRPSRTNILPTEVTTVVYQNIMLLEGSYSTEQKFEPYVGGKPSPNPDYPQDIEVSGESYNLLENTATSQTLCGVSYTVNDNKSVLMNGTAEMNNSDSWHWIALNNNVKLPIGDYILSGVKGGVSHTYKIQFRSQDFAHSFEQYDADKLITITEEMSQKTFLAFLGVRYQTTVDNVTVYPMIRKASVKNDRYMPYGKGSVEVKSLGKNILNPNYCHDGGASNGVTMVNNNDNTFTFSGSKADSSIPCSFTKNYGKGSLGFLFSKAGKYTLSISGGDGYNKGLHQYFFVNLFYGGTNYYNVLMSKSKFTVEITEEILAYDDLNASYGFYASTADEIYNGTLKVQIEYGGVATDFQPHKESKAIINGEFAGIKVDSNGNYTDQNGQQWICDEIVKYADGSGAYVQRIGKEVFNGSETWYLGATNNYNDVSFTAYHDFVKPIPFIGQWVPIPSITNNFMKSKGNLYGVSVTNECYMVCRETDEYASTKARISIRLLKTRVSEITQSAVSEWISNNPITLYYQLREPITTPLTAEEIAEISTFYPITNISNDFDCGMRIEYVGDSIITTNTEIPVVAQDGELESGDNIVTLFGKIAKKLKSLAGSNVQQQLTDIVTRLDALERNQKTIVYSDTEPETVEENTIVMVYEAEE